MSCVYSVQLPCSTIRSCSSIACNLLFSDISRHDPTRPFGRRLCVPALVCDDAPYRRCSRNAGNTQQLHTSGISIVASKEAGSRRHGRIGTCLRDSADHELLLKPKLYMGQPRRRPWRKTFETRATFLVSARFSAAVRRIHMRGEHGERFSGAPERLDSDLLVRSHERNGNQQLRRTRMEWMLCNLISQLA